MTSMLPLTRFKTMLETYQQQINEDLGELVMAAELVGSRPNYILLDEEGYYHLQVSGKLDTVIDSMTKQLDKLCKIKHQKDRT